MLREEINIAEAKAHFSELINKVFYRQQEIVITKRGKPVAVISTPSSKGLASVKGWLEDSDPFFTTIKEVVKKRHVKRLRAATGHKD